MYTWASFQSTFTGKPAGSWSSRHSDWYLHSHRSVSWSGISGGACLPHYCLGTVDAQTLGTPADAAARDYGSDCRSAFFHPNRDQSNVTLDPHKLCSFDLTLLVCRSSYTRWPVPEAECA